MTKGVIKSISAEEIIDSVGRPTLKVSMSSESHTAEVSVPSGQSRGTMEAFELRDTDGGMDKAIEMIQKEISPALVGKELNQKLVDEALIALDGTPNKSRLGGNTTIGVSMATARLIAKERGVPLWKNISEENNAAPKEPALFMNIINGGVHADFRLPFQEYMVLVCLEKVSDSYKTGYDIFLRLGKVVREKFGDVPYGDEGGYSPASEDIEEPFKLLVEAIGSDDAKIAIDAAATEFFQSGKYRILGKDYTADELLALYKNLILKYPLRSIEDPFEESALKDFEVIESTLGENISVVGDDFTVTSPERIKKLAESRAANAVIIKPNQIGTLTEVYEAVRLAHSYGWKTIVSHRSGDTIDDFIADLAVGLGTYGIKAGSPYPPERRAKYDRLVAIEGEMVK